ncbi:MAG: VCBS repeat-containing protein, partial [Acidobacteria bacterium]|nr:VCBS repeat-containing protein [Acidobacteriota bacterium]
VTTAQMVQSVSDSCASLNPGQVVIEQVTSDEPDNGLGDGDTANDIVIAPDCKAVQLRAERAGGGNGRVYSVRLRVQDAAGNVTRREFKVSVPLNQNGSPAIEDAPVATVVCGGGSALPTSNAARPAVPGDFDGDRQTDFAVWRGQQSDWLVLASTNDRLALTPWGAQYAPYNDVLAPGDYDGDGKADQAVYRRGNGTFYVRGSATGAVITQALGTGKDEPVPGDYDGDGKTDFAVWQAARGMWLIQGSGGQRLTLQWGAGDAPYFDVPVAGDYDGDGKTDLAVYRRGTGTWYIRRSSDGSALVQAWGNATDVPVPGDYDGDGKTNLAVWRGGEGNWYVLRSVDGKYQITAWGAARVGDVPVPGDYDGDGRTDLAVWREPEGTWYVRLSGNQDIRVHQHGQAGDTPLLACHPQ